jgi:hypothetical protein
MPEDTMLLILDKNLSQNIHQDNFYSSVELTKMLLVKKTRVGLDDLTAVLMKISVFWDITTCSPVKVNQHFGGTHHLQPQS